MTINAALRRHLPASIRNLSSAGGLLESRHLYPVGAVGLLEVELGGVRYVEWFRVTRVEPSRDAGVPYEMAVEFLPLSLAGDESLRRAMRGGRIARRPPVQLAGAGKLSGNTGTSARASTDGHTTRQACSAISPAKLRIRRRSGVSSGWLHRCS